MNHWRSKILLGALAGVVVTMLFPPFSLRPGGNRVVGRGFHFILYGKDPSDGMVDIPLLLTEWLAIAIVCGILWMLTRGTRTPRVAQHGTDTPATEPTVDPMDEIDQGYLAIAERVDAGELSVKEAEIERLELRRRERELLRAEQTLP